MNDYFEISDLVTALYLGRMSAYVDISTVGRALVIELITAGRSGDIGLAPAAVSEVV